jgi:hypothetical protein
MSEQRRNPIQWQFTGSSGVMRAGQAYGLKNNVIGKRIAYGERDAGVNLVWVASDAGPNITLIRASGARDVIKHGDFFAIRIKGGKHLRYQKRTVGVNLGWSDAPLEEWQIVGGKEGDPVTLQQPLALKNKVEDDVLVYAVREFGINFRWEKDYQLEGDRSLTELVLELGVDAAMIFAEAKGVPPVVTQRVRTEVGTHLK